jgi:hypothetical protein
MYTINSVRNNNNYYMDERERACKLCFLSKNCSCRLSLLFFVHVLFAGTKTSKQTRVRHGISNRYHT